jgi:Mannose-6-phosphate isomerase
MSFEIFKIATFSRNWGKVFELITNNKNISVAIEVISPGKHLGKHYHKTSKEIEILLEGAPIVNGEKKFQGDIFIWNQEEIHEYDNSQNDKEIVILTISIPSYSDDDEIFV